MHGGTKILLPMFVPTKRRNQYNDAQYVQSYKIENSTKVQSLLINLNYIQTVYSQLFLTFKIACVCKCSKSALRGTFCWWSLYQFSWQWHSHRNVSQITLTPYHWEWQNCQNIKQGYWRMKAKKRQCFECWGKKGMCLRLHMLSLLSVIRHS